MATSTNTPVGGRQSGRVTRAAALVAGAASLMVMAGWLFNLSALRGGTDATATHPATAVIMLLIATAIWSADTAKRWVRYIGNAAAAAVVLTATLLVIGPVLGVSPDFESEIFRTWLAPLGEHAPKPLTPGAGFFWFTVGLALVLLRYQSEVWYLLGRAIGLFVACLGVLLFGLYVIRGFVSSAQEIVPATLVVLCGFTAIGLGIGTGFMPAVLRDGWSRDAGMLRRKVNLVLGLAIGILFVTGGVAMWSAIRTQSYTSTRQANREKRTELTELLVALQEAEAARFGAVPAARDRLLTAYGKTLVWFKRDVPADTDSLHNQALVQLEPLVEQRLGELTAATRAQAEGREAHADSLIQFGSSRPVRLQLQQTLATIAREEDALVSKWDDRINTTVGITLLCNFFGGSIAIFFLFLVGRRINEDIRGRVEAELERDQFFELSVDMLCVANSDWTFRRISPAFSTTLAWRTEDILRRSFLHLVHEDDRAATQAEFDRMDGENVSVASFENRCQHRNGGWRILSWRAVRKPGGNYYVAAHDVTEARESEARLKALKDSAESANRAKSDFLAKMSHELRTPLNSIIGFSELLEEERIGPLTPKQQRYVSNVLVSGKNLLQLINDILDLSKVEAGRMELMYEEFDVNSAVEQVSAIVSSLAERKNLAIAFALPSGLPPLRADQGKFKQIMYNLLGNAIKFTPDGGRVTVSTRRVVDDSAPYIEIEVTDTGIGIAPQNLHRIFGEFEQVQDGNSTAHEGTGLGLALTKKLVELHGGDIAVESTVGEGSVFRVRMPCRTPVGTLVSPVVSDGPEPSGNRDQPLVLVVEDDPQARELIHDYLTEVGYAVQAVDAGRYGIELAESLMPCAITLDISLPDQDGLMVLAQLKTNPATRNIPVVVVSIAEKCEVGFSLGALDWLVKPVDRDVLLRCLADAVEQRAPAPPCVLVVDDEPAVIEYATEMLQQLGCQVLAAGGGVEGIALATRHVPDVIILDISMPDVSGFEVVHALKAQERTREIPILVVTALDLSASQKNALLQSVQAIVAKGWREEFLVELSKCCPIGPTAVRADQ